MFDGLIDVAADIREIDDFLSLRFRFFRAQAIQRSRQTDVLLRPV